MDGACDRGRWDHPRTRVRLAPSRRSDAAALSPRAGIAARGPLRRAEPACAATVRHARRAARCCGAAVTACAQHRSDSSLKWPMRSATLFCSRSCSTLRRGEVGHGLWPWIDLLYGVYP
ncbi:hypothetical protein AURDEDRAFT_186654 [Auricularia subglabra TFB-10046 SS5]|nr:hypothetical protein AURDEDRAFT_186654 [Auricularia subglabra TFB-10046 SS5]